MTGTLAIPSLPVVLGLRGWYVVESSSDGTKLFAADGLNVYVSADSGVTWTKVEILGFSNIMGLACSSDGTTVYAVNDSNLYRSTDSGITWTNMNNPKSWRSITCSSDGTKIVAGAAGFYFSASGSYQAFSGGKLWTSTNSGSTFTERSVPNIQLGGGAWNKESVASSADGTKLVAVENHINSNLGGRWIWTSTDSGANWTERIGGQLWTSVASSSDGVKLVVCAQNNYIYTSTNSGVNWTQQTGSGSRNWISITSSSDGTKLAAAVQNGYLYTSTDSGVTWTQRATAKNWSSIASSSNGTKLIAVINSGVQYTSIDSGVTWTTLTPDYYPVGFVPSTSTLIAIR